MKTLDRSRLTRISSDSLSVNLDFFFESIESEQHDEGNHPRPIYIITCSLHTVHGSLKNRIISSGWKIDGVLRWMRNLLKEHPARREINKKITNSIVYLLPYCKIRWCENKQTAERAVEI